jgi:predicted DNA-binding transcriptional regulator YafY
MRNNVARMRSILWGGDLDRTERFYRILAMLRSRKCVPAADFLRELEISAATFKRDLEYMRDRLKAPVEWDRESGGYRFSKDAPASELPGLWLTPNEIHALLATEQLLDSLEPGILGAYLAPLRERLTAALGDDARAVKEVRKRIRLLPISRRRMDARFMAEVATGVITRRRLRLSHFNRLGGGRTEREVSPQRLVHYRSNWYVDTWCHLRNDVRSFSVDAIEGVELLDIPAKEVDDKTLDDILAAGYGIFAGKETQWATLRFTPQQSRWAAAEEWHPSQRGRMESDGSYLLEVPYSNSRELLMDVLRYGPDVEIVSPPTLREQVKVRAAETVRRYGATA